MLTHQQVWGAVDRIADRYGYSPSGLAKASGLDPTTFNPSKRIAGDGRLRMHEGGFVEDGGVLAKSVDWHGGAGG